MSNLKKVKKIGVQAEYDPAKLILMHTPGPEYKEGMNFPEAALFDGPGRHVTAIQEHKNYIKRLRGKGITVHTLTDILLDGVIDKEGRITHGKEFDILRQLARDSLHTIILPDISSHERRLLKKRQEIAFNYKSPEELLEIIFTQPTITLKYHNEENSIFRREDSQRPLYNMMFMRDQMITTDKGVILSNMSSRERSSERAIVRLALQKLGIDPIHQISSGTLEGGDFMPAGKDKNGKSFALIGQGLRTNEKCIEELINHGKELFGYDYIAIVKDDHSSQNEMHLDTYFNIPGPRMATVLQNRFEASKTTGRRKIPRVDIYKIDDTGEYSLDKTNLPFDKFLKERGFAVLIVPEEVQLNYGLNYLTLGPGEIVGVDIAAKAQLKSELAVLEHGHTENDLKTYRKEVSAHFRKIGTTHIEQLAKHIGISTDAMKDMTLPFTHLNQAYGGPHCLTQVLYREPMEYKNQE